MTRVAAPPSFVLGTLVVLTARGMQRWKDLARGEGALKRNATIVWLTATIRAPGEGPPRLWAWAIPTSY